MKQLPAEMFTITEIGGVGYILRGYERFDEKLRSLGAQIENVVIQDTGR